MSAPGWQDPRTRVENGEMFLRSLAGTGAPAVEERGGTAVAQAPKGAADPVQELVERAKARDERAFAALYELYAPKIHSYFYYHLNGRSHEAEDLTNEVFVKVLEKIRTFEFRGLPFSSWLYRIAHNHLIDHVRGQPKLGPVALEDCLELREERAQRDLDNALSAQDLKEALWYLTAEQRQVIVLRFVQGLNTLETALAMDRSEDAVKKLQARGLMMLKKVLVNGRSNGRH